MALRSQSCCNILQQSVWLKQQTFFSAGSWEIHAQDAITNSEKPLPSLQMAVLVYPYMAKNRNIKRSSPVCFYKGTNHIHEAPPLWHNTKRSHFLMPLHWRLGLQNMNSGYSVHTRTKLLNTARFCNQCWRGGQPLSWRTLCVIPINFGYNGVGNKKSGEED